MHKLKFKKPSLKSSLFLLLYGIYSFISILDLSLLPMDGVMKLTRYTTMIGCYFLFMMKSVSNKTSIRKIILEVLVAGFFVLAASVTSRSYLIIYAAFILLANSSSIKEIIKTSLFASLSALLVIMFCIGFGLIEDYIYTYGTRRCHCLGFAYYSTVPFILYYCLLMYVYLKKGKLRIHEYIILLLLNYGVFYVTTLRLTFYLTLLSLLITFIFDRFTRLSINVKILRAFSWMSFPTGIIITYLLMKYYTPSNTKLFLLNTALNSRLKYMHLGYVQYPINLLGHAIEMEGASAIRQVTNYFYIDSGFAYSLLGYGALFTILVVLLYTIILNYSCVCDDKPLFIWIVSVLIFTMINNTWVSINYNPILLGSFIVVGNLRRIRRASKDKNKKGNIIQRGLL